MLAYYSWLLHGKCKHRTDISRVVCFLTAGPIVLSPEQNLAHRMMSALPPFVPSSSHRVTNEQCIKDSQLYLQEVRNLAFWALKSEYLQKVSRVAKWKSSHFERPSYRTWSSRPPGIWSLFSTSPVSYKCHPAVAYRRRERGLGGGAQPHPPNSEGHPKWCQTQPDCENC